MAERTFGHFDADTYRASQEEPTLVIGRLLYRGRLLGIEEWLAYSDALDAYKARDASPREWVALYRRYLTAVFPRRRYRFWAPDPVKALLAMPFGVVTEAIARFFDLQALATMPATGQSQSSTSGTDSPPSIPPAPDVPTSPSP